MQRYSIIIPSILLILTAISPIVSNQALCGYISGDIAQRVIDDPAEFYTVYVSIVDRDKTGFEETAASLQTYTRQARHARIIEALKTHSARSQENIVQLLTERQNSGDVESFKSYWIDNVVVVTARGSLIEELSYRADVERIFEAGGNLLIKPVESYPAANATMDTLPSALKVIGADSMWALGYTGQGTIVCNLDTGIDGDHPALENAWRGNNGYSAAESWFDPIDGEDYPHTFSQSSNPQHGTHVMGIMVGHDDATGDTIGVAPDANWISAAVIDIPSALVLDGLEWAADPDGNPNTVTDVPDVVCNSWGYQNWTAGCEDVFWDAIDNLETLGTVVVFACGNSGSYGPSSITNPANRATSEYNSLAIGMIDPTDPSFPVYYKSSQGPSDCDGVSLKPQITAPGVNIRSTVPVINGSYGLMTGTSMAAPHVAGAVALLRQYNPNAPVDSIKRALMETAIDIEETGTDYKSGYGLIYIPAALEALTPNSNPNLFVFEISNDTPTSGGAIDVTINLKNSGLGILSVYGTLRTDSDLATIGDSSFYYGDIALDGTSENTDSPFSITFADDITTGTQIDFTLYLTGLGGYEKEIPLKFRVGEKQQRSRWTHDAGAIAFTISNYGVYGFGSNSLHDLGLTGFVWPEDGENHLYEMGFIVAVDSVHVSDGIRDPIWEADADFEVAPGGNLLTWEPGENAEEETYSIFDDSKAEDPIGIRISQWTLAYDGSPNEDYIFMIYRLYNDSDSTLSGVRAGLMTDWDWPFDPSTGGSFDKAGYYTEANLGYMYNTMDEDSRGIAILNPEGMTSFKAALVDEYYERSDESKWDLISNGIQEPVSSPQDRSIIVTTGPFDILPGDSVEAAFAIIGAESILDLYTSADYAARKYNSVKLTGTAVEIDSVSSDQKSEVSPSPYIKPSDASELPLTYSLDQNYPNPFNPSTTINFSIEKDAHTRLTIYNILGQRVATLVDSDLAAGRHSVVWDASGLASGLYLYRLESGDYTEVRKMALTR